MTEPDTGDLNAQSHEGSIWDRKVTPSEKKATMSIFVLLYVVFIGAGVWWAHQHEYGVVGYLGLVAIAFVAVWLVVLVLLIGIAIVDLVRRH